MKSRKNWPVLTSYDSNHLRRLALPLGGIGTGTVSLGGRGNLLSWEVVNRPAKLFTPDSCFFALYAKPAGQDAVCRALEGQIDEADYEGASGCPVPNHGLPRFRKCSFRAAYPLGQVLLSDPDVPVDVRLEAFNPLVPPDADKSGIPVAVLRYVLRNKTGRAVTASVCGSLRNFIGTDGSGGSSKDNVNAFKKSGKVQGVMMTSQGVDKSAEQYGTMALATLATSGVTHRTAWEAGGWATSILDFWDDLSADGKLDDRDREKQEQPVGSLAAGVTIPPRGTREITFLLTWHFPNRQTWTPAKAEKPTDGKAEGNCGCGAACDPNYIGNYYATQYADAWAVAERTAAALPKLEAETVEFVDTFCKSDLPQAVKEAALCNVSTLRTQTCFRTDDGRFYGFEGCCDNVGCCLGSCTHVWNYEHTTALLFGSLARSMREVEFMQAVHDDGCMSFRVHLPVERAQESRKAAADGQMGCLMKMYRDWQLSGDTEMLKRFWPNVKKAVSFCWAKGGWDADKDGVMEGCQHNTMDVDYVGPNGQMCVWYLGALRASEEMAKAVGDPGFAATCRGLFERGRAWVDANLFNGEYYEHHIRPIKAADIEESTQLAYGGGETPDWQLGKACLVDQLVGQYTAHVCGLGHLVDPGHVKTTLKSIMKYNFGPLDGHFNNMRTFAMNGEKAILMATYPQGERPTRPFPYFNEVMTGFEYAAAIGMLYEGQTAAGLRAIKAIRARYDGRKRSPFDEAECGHHYARAMAAWAAVPALTGFHYSGVDGAMTFAAKSGLHFWSNGNAWGTCRIKASKKAASVELTVKAGSLKVRTLALTGLGETALKTAKTIAAGKALRLQVRGG